MRKICIPVILVLLLASCSPAQVTLPSGHPTGANDGITGTSSPSNPLGNPGSSTPCTVLHQPVTPEAALGAEFADRGHVSGPADAPVTIIAFSDYQCVPCAYLAASLKQIRLTHPTDVRLIYLHAPQVDRDKDYQAIQAVEAADLQGKFWEMHDLLFETLDEWSGIAPADFKDWVTANAVSLGMDSSRFQADFGGALVAGRLQQAIQFTADAELDSPPRLFVNSTTPYTSLADFASLDMVVRMKALADRQFSACPTVAMDPQKQYLVTMHTSKGDVSLQLFPEKAPLAVNNFLFLIGSGWYDGITFYRVLLDQRVLSGDPSETGFGNPGYLFDTEIAPGLRFDQPGILAMDNDGPGTNGSRFFITLAAAPQLNGQYTIIGQVLSGMEVLSSLTPRNSLPGVYLPPGDELITVTVVER
jgi:peptidyl-prolyl cis-trans isomerase B (cyclophilin B)